MLPSTVERVPSHTCDKVNERIRYEAAQRVRYFTQHPEQIERRLHELDEEWDVERTLEANAATLVVTGSALAATVDRRWAILPLAVAGFLLQHALQGWCPPLPILRRLGFRTAHEINVERYALKYVRGDFSHGDHNDPNAALEAVGGDRRT